MKDHTGKIYRIDWPEYHVTCNDCETSAMVSPLGECTDRIEAIARFTKDSQKPNLEVTGWTYRRGVFRCSTCSKKGNQ